MRNGWDSIYQLSTVSNLGEILIRCRGRVKGIFTTKKASASDRNATKIANSRKLLSNEPPLSHNWRYSLVLQAFLLCDIAPPLIGFDVH